MTSKSQRTPKVISTTPQHSNKTNDTLQHHMSPHRIPQPNYTPPTTQGQRKKMCVSHERRGRSSSPPYPPRASRSVTPQTPLFFVYITRKVHTSQKHTKTNRWSFAQTIPYYKLLSPHKTIQLRYTTPKN